MPFKSEKQRKWMHSNEPEMAKKWEKKKKREGGPGSGRTKQDAQSDIEAQDTWKKKKPKKYKKNYINFKKTNIYKL